MQFFLCGPFFIFFVRASGRGDNDAARGVYPANFTPMLFWDAFRAPILATTRWFNIIGVLWWRSRWLASRCIIYQEQVLNHTTMVLLVRRLRLSYCYRAGHEEKYYCSSSNREWGLRSARLFVVGFSLRGQLKILHNKSRVSEMVFIQIVRQQNLKKMPKVLVDTNDNMLRFSLNNLLKLQLDFAYIRRGI